MTTSSTMTSAELSRSLEIIEVKPGLRFTKQSLMRLLPDTETALFFGKLYDLDYVQMSGLLSQVSKSTLSDVLFNESACHNTDLQDYIVDLVAGVHDVSDGAVNYAADVPHGEILPQMWESLEIVVASSIKQVADKLKDTVNAMPSKQGEMLMRSMMVLNKKRPTIGDYKAKVHHRRVTENLVILDVSGSMNSRTVEAIVEDVVALAYMANAHFAVVSNSCVYWTPGSYGVSEILAAAEYGGTYYEQLAPLFDRDWGTVVTIADYDSSPSAKEVLAACPGRIDEVLDISLVNRPTYLAQCVGQLASEVRPLLVANTTGVLGSSRY